MGVALENLFVGVLGIVQVSVRERTCTLLCE